MRKLVTVGEVARSVGLSPEVVRRLFNRGAIPGEVMAGRILLEEGPAVKVALEHTQCGRRRNRAAA